MGTPTKGSKTLKPRLVLSQQVPKPTRHCNTVTLRAGHACDCTPHHGTCKKALKWLAKYGRYDGHGGHGTTLAADEKHRLEVKQRAVRKERKDAGEIGKVLADCCFALLLLLLLRARDWVPSLI